jgi:hypothetical protein
MMTMLNEILLCVGRARYLLTALAFLVVATRPASAQWTANDAQRAYTAYNNAFLYLEPDGYSKVFVTTQGGTTMQGLWTFANEIQAAEDAYSENPTTANMTEVQALCDGWVNYMTWSGVKVGDDWSSDPYDDDLMWATIAFARAYAVTGTTRWLTDAENNFNAVYERGLASNGGMYWVTKGCTGHPATGCDSTFQNSAANWTFVIAGRLLTNYSGDST